MWSFITQPGVASATVDFTKDLSWLACGLFGFVVLSAALLTLMVIQQRVVQATKPLAETIPASMDSQEAA